MTLAGTHKFVVHALVAIGMAPLAMSGEIPMPVVAGTYLAVLGSWFAKVPRELDPKSSRRWTWLTLVAALLCVAAGFFGGQWLLAPILLMLVLVVTRLYQSRSSRHVFQLYGLTFMAMVAGAVLNPMLSFLVLFLLYVVLLVWGLVLLHLQRDLEQLAREREGDAQEMAREGWQARSVVRPGFLAGSSLLALVVFLASLGIFFLFPRLGMGFFYQQGRHGETMSGFSDTIQLGHFGTIKDNLRVVMRVDLLDGGTDRNKKLRLRGISFDHYDGTTWSKTTQVTSPVRQSAPGRWALDEWQPQARWARDGVRRTPGAPVRYQVYLEPLQLGERMIFGIPRLESLAIANYRIDQLKKERTRFFQDAAQDVSTHGRSDVAISYEAVSIEDAIDPAALERAEEPMPDPVRDLYLQLPERLDPRIAGLASSLTASVPTQLGKVRALERHLRTAYKYTTEGGHDPADPLADFLFGKKSGHCEYFASALVILLRTQGIAARPANGFYGGAYNEYGQYYAVRQADAHSWVEVWFPVFGWLTFDPTPPSLVLVPGADGWLGSLEAWIDSVRLQWFRWVVEYDLEKQFEVFRDLATTLQGIFPAPSGPADDPRAWAQGAREWAQNPMTWLKIGGLVLLLVFLRFGLLPLFRWGRGAWARWRQGEVAPAEVVAYAEMLRILARQGWPRGPAETPRELAMRVATGGHPAAPEVARVTRAYEQVRFAEKRSRGAAFREILRAIREGGALARG